MIAVIADDFTGAAEIGGIGLRYGLDVVIKTEDITHTHTDLLVVATDTRSLNKKEAASAIENVANKVKDLKPDFIYKKCDSVLRGNILDELQAQMKVTAKNRALVVAANPTFQRVIKGGKYYISGTPLHETSFSNDPEYPVSSSYVEDIVGKGKVLSNIVPNGSLPPEGLILGDVTSIEDLKRWATKVDNDTLPAGGSGFFREILNKLNIKSEKVMTEHIPYGKNALYVMGSTFPKQYNLNDKISKSNHFLSNMPEELYNNPALDSPYLDKWADQISLAMHDCHKVVVAIPQKSANLADCTDRIRTIIGVLVKKVFDRTTIDELIVEGGATTWQILKALDIKELLPFHEFETGIIRMKVKEKPGLYITTKPGSYLWPDKIWYLGENDQVNIKTHKEPIK